MTGITFIKRRRDTEHHMTHCCSVTGSCCATAIINSALCKQGLGTFRYRHTASPLALYFASSLIHPLASWLATERHYTILV